MKRTIYIHIGFGKTGTTTLQFGLRDNYETLLELGWLYPRATRNFGNNSAHHNIGYEIRNDPQFDSRAGGVQDLVEEIEKSNAENIIISSEVLGWNSAPLLQQALSPLGKIKVVVYVRPQIKWMVSLWAQKVKTGLTALTFEDWYKLDGSKRGNYFGYLKRWAKIVGEKNIIVQPLERAQMKGHILEDFLLACGFANIDDLTIPDNENISPGIKTLEIIRYFTNIFGEKKPPGGNFARRILASSEELTWEDPRPQVVTEETWHSIQTKYAKINKRVAKVYLDKEVLFEDEVSFDGFVKFDLKQVSLKEWLSLMGIMLKKAWKKLTRNLTGNG